MYKKQIPDITSINHNDSVQGETIEAKVRRILNNKEPIKDGAPIIYTDRADGVHPMYDIRTDRFEVAIESQEHTVKNRIAKREERAKAAKGETTPQAAASGEAAPIAGTAPDTAA